MQTHNNVLSSVASEELWFFLECGLAVPELLKEEQNFKWKIYLRNQ